MRLLIVLAVLASGSLRICGSESPAPPAPTASAPMVPAAPAPVPAPIVSPAQGAAVPAPAPLPPVTPVIVARFGGAVIPVGAQSVEVIPMSDGTVAAYLNDVSGNPVSMPTGEVEVRLGTAPQPALLAWEPLELRYTGRAAAPLTPGPVEVTVKQGGQTQTGRADLVAVVSPPERGGVVLAVGGSSAEVVAHSDGSVHAFLAGPSGRLTDPSLQLVAKVSSGPGATQDVSLSYDAELGGYAGHLAAGASAMPGPVQLSLTQNGQTSVGGMDTLAVLPAAEHGGTLLAAGDISVEVVSASNGEIGAYLRDPSGAPVPSDGLALTVKFCQPDRDPQPVVLTWNAPQARFVGRLRGAVRFEQTPVEVLVLRSGRRLRGRVAQIRPVFISQPPPVPMPVVQPPPPVIFRPPPPPVVVRQPPPPVVVRQPPPPVVSRPPPPPVVSRPPPPPVVGAPHGPPPGKRPPPPPAVSPGQRRPGGIELRGGIRIGN